jgi:hypothetical protein
MEVTFLRHHESRVVPALRSPGNFLILNLLTTTIVAPPSNASTLQMGFNSAFKGLVPKWEGYPNNSMEIRTSLNSRYLWHVCTTYFAVHICCTSTRVSKALLEVHLKFWRINFKVTDIYSQKATGGHTLYFEYPFTISRFISDGSAVITLVLCEFVKYP